MTPPTYSLASILPFVRQSLRQRGCFSYHDFLFGFWGELERAGVPGILRISPERDFSNQRYAYNDAPAELRAVTTEAFYYLFHNGFSIPEPPDNLPGRPSEIRYHLTPRGLAWAKRAEPLPEDTDGYMSSLRKLVPTLDPVIDQYIREGLSAFNRQTYFAAAVMVGAASEKAVYLLAESMVDVFADAKRKTDFERLVDRRRLKDLFEEIEQTIREVRNAKIPHSYAVFDGAETHVLSLIEAIRVQRNDAVHPMNATVSVDSVRHSFSAFPHTLEKLEALREWFGTNPKSI